MGRDRTFSPNWPNVRFQACLACPLLAQRGRL